MFNMKKILITGTVLTAFCTSAFAASADSLPQPSMSERVNAILHENDADRPCPPPAHRMHRQGPKLTPEQRAERKKMREEWKSMTPEQREKAVEKMRKERKEAHEKYAKETMAKLTPAQKAEYSRYGTAQSSSRTPAEHDSRATRGYKSQQTAAAEAAQTSQR